MVTGAGVSEQVSSRDLDMQWRILFLYFIDSLFGGCITKKTVAVLNTGCDKAMDQAFSTREGEGQAYFSQWRKSVFEICGVGLTCCSRCLDVDPYKVRKSPVFTFCCYLLVLMLLLACNRPLPLKPSVYQLALASSYFCIFRQN